MNETAKMYTIRKNRGDFDLYLRGTGLDIGCGADLLKTDNGEVRGINHDGEHLSSFCDDAFDFVYSSHCLEHLNRIDIAIRNWSRVLKSGGYLYIVVPDWVIYEKKQWPSPFNGDHKHTFSLDYTKDMLNRGDHWHIDTDFRALLENNDLELIKAELEDFGYDYNNPQIDQTFTTDYAVCQICIIAKKAKKARKAGKKNKIEKAPVPYVEFGGGLGDIINQMFRTPNYSYFENITEKTAAVLITHNPYSGEIFKYHPKNNLIEVIIEPWVHPHEAEERVRAPLSCKGYRRIIPSLSRNVPPNLYPSPEDKALLENIKKEQQRFAVIQPFAGTKERDIPPPLLNLVMNHLVLAHQMSVVIVGRSYERAGAFHSNESGDMLFSGEIGEILGSSVINLIDKLSVPGTIQMVKECSLFFGSHSSMNIAAWHFNKPSVVLYDSETRDRHFLRTDEWSFGKDFHNTRHSLYGDFNVSMIDETLQI